MAVAGLVEERMDFVPVLASFEVSVAMDYCASASFVLACPSCRMRSAIVFDMFANVVRSDCVAVARFSKVWLWSCVISANMAAFSDFLCLTVHNLHVELAWTGPFFPETPTKM